jgi:hypothetical protein
MESPVNEGSEDIKDTDELDSTEKCLHTDPSESIESCESNCENPHDSLSSDSPIKTSEGLKSIQEDP